MKRIFAILLLWLPLAAGAATTDTQVLSGTTSTQAMGSTTAAALNNLYVVVTPGMFGAVGDGITDDTTHLQNWLNACAGAFRTCSLGPGSAGSAFKTTASLVYNAATGGPIRIVGSRGSIIVPNGAFDALQINDTVGASRDFISIDGLAFQAGATTNLAALHLTGVAAFAIRNVNTIYGSAGKVFATGIRFTGSQQGEVDGGQIQGCTNGILTEPTAGVNSNGIEIHGVTFANNTNANISEDADDGFVHDNHIIGGAYGIYANGTGTGALTFRSNHIELTTTYGIDVTASAWHARIEKNSIYDSGSGGGINIDAPYAQVINNLISGTAVITANGTGSIWAMNDQGGTFTSSVSDTVAFGNHTLGSGGEVGAQLNDGLVLNSRAASPGDMLTLNPVSASGSWGATINGAGVNQDIYLKLGSNAAVVGNTSSGLVAFKSAPGAPAWATINASGINSANTINSTNAYYENGVPGVSCTGAPTASFAVSGGIVTHC